MPFPCMNHLQTLGAPRRQQSSVRLDRASETRNVVAQHLAEPARFQKISLHVDDQKRAMPRLELERIRLGINAHGPIGVHVDSSLIAWNAGVIAASET